MGVLDYQIDEISSLRTVKKMNMSQFREQSLTPMKNVGHANRKILDKQM